MKSHTSNEIQDIFWKLFAQGKQKTKKFKDYCIKEWLSKEGVFKIINDLIDHYTPYRPIGDDKESLGARNALNKLKQKLGER